MHVQHDSYCLAQLSVSAGARGHPATNPPNAAAQQLMLQILWSAMYICRCSRSAHREPQRPRMRGTRHFAVPFGRDRVELCLGHFDPLVYSSAVLFGHFLARSMPGLILSSWR